MRLSSYKKIKKDGGILDKIYKKSKPFDFNFQGLECNLELCFNKKYENGHSIVRVLKIKSPSAAFLFATLSQDLPHLKLSTDEFILNNNPLYEEFIQYLIDEKKYFQNTGKKAFGKYGETSILKIKCE